VLQKIYIRRQNKSHKAAKLAHKVAKLAQKAAKLALKAAKLAANICIAHSKEISCTPKK